MTVSIFGWPPVDATKHSATVQPVTVIRPDPSRPPISSGGDQIDEKMSTLTTMESRIDEKMATLIALQTQVYSETPDAHEGQESKSISADDVPPNVPIGSKLSIGKISSSSTGGAYGPEVLIDGDTKAGHGWFTNSGDTVGARIEFQLADLQTVNGIRINQPSLDFTAGSCIATASLIFDDGSAQTISVDNVSGWQYRRLSQWRHARFAYGLQRCITLKVVAMMYRSMRSSSGAISIRENGVPAEVRSWGLSRPAACRLEYGGIGNAKTHAVFDIARALI